MILQFYQLSHIASDKRAKYTENRNCSGLFYYNPSIARAGTLKNHG